MHANKLDLNANKLYIVTIGVISYKEGCDCETILVNCDGIDKRIATLKGHVFIDILNSQTYYSWNQTNFHFKTRHMNDYLGYLFLKYQI